MRLQNADSLEEEVAKIQLLRDVATPFGGHPLKIQSVSLIGNLDGTGGDPPPSGYRQLLMSEMQNGESRIPIKSSPHHPLRLCL